MSQHNQDAFAQAKQLLAGGVNSPVRAFRAVGGTPLFFERAQGSRLTDIEGREYIDYVCSWGALILGHAAPKVVDAVAAAARLGLSFGAPTLHETRLAELTRRFFPSMQRMRMCNSGSEATMSAIRLARGFTGRDGVVKFAGCYHGHGDALLVKAGSGALTLGVPDSAGVPNDLAKHTLVAAYNDLDGAARLFREHGSKIACVIVEPVAGNMGCVPPEPGFLSGLAQLCSSNGSVLIFDEVMSGFRVARGGAQQLYAIEPDLTTLGKIVGGGMPVGIFGGREEIMRHLAPDGPVYQAGTLSGNPVAMAAGIATLETLNEQLELYDIMDKRTARLCEGICKAADAAGIGLSHNRCGSMFGLFFTEAGPPKNLEQTMQCDTRSFGRFFHAMLSRGIYMAPSACEAGFVSAAHGDPDIIQTVEAAAETFSSGDL